MPFNVWVKANDDLLETFGTNALFEIGKNVGKNLPFPPSVTNLEQVLNIFPIVFDNFHRNGKAGYAKVIFFNHAEKKAQIESFHPYPMPIDRGVYLEASRKFESSVTVEIDENLSFEDKKVYNVSW